MNAQNWNGWVLGVFAKQPIAGQVKTRLADVLSNKRAAEFAEAMLVDTLSLCSDPRCLGPEVRRVLVFDPPDSGPWFDAHVPESFALQPQAEGDLGVRMERFIAGEFEDGASRVVLIGSDSPTLDPNFVLSAFVLLEHKDVVLGPATDGGFYLVGARKPLPTLFEDIAWSTPGVLSHVVQSLARQQLSLALLPPWYDVDTLADVHMMIGHLRAQRLAGQPLPPTRVESVWQGWCTGV